MPLIYNNCLFHLHSDSVTIKADGKYQGNRELRQKTKHRDEKLEDLHTDSQDGIDESVAKERLAIQPEIEYYRNHADYLMGNNGNLNEINLEEICTKIGKN